MSNFEHKLQLHSSQSHSLSVSHISITLSPYGSGGNPGTGTSGGVLAANTCAAA